MSLSQMNLSQIIPLFDANFVIFICFLIFLYLTYRPISKAIRSGLNSRIKQIEDKLNETAKLKQEAQNLLDDIKQEMLEFEERKKSILNNAKTSTEQLIATRVKESELMLKRKKDSAVKSIKNQQEKAGKQMRDEFTSHVMKIVKTYLAETNNNQLSDAEIIQHFLDEKSK